MNGKLAFGDAEADDVVDVLALPEPSFGTSDMAAAVLGAAAPRIADTSGAALKTSGAVDVMFGEHGQGRADEQKLN